MPAMVRSNKKAERIAHSLLGVPANMQGNKRSVRRSPQGSRRVILERGLYAQPHDYPRQLKY